MTAKQNFILGISAFYHDSAACLLRDGSFRLNQEYFDYLGGLTMTNGKFDKLFGGPPRVPETKLTQREMDLARSVQDVCEEVLCSGPPAPLREH